MCWECLDGVSSVSGWCLESVWRFSWKCLYGCLVSDWKVFGRGSLVRFIDRNSMVRTGWIKTGLVSSCLDMSGRNILDQKFLDMKIFVIQNILGDERNHWAKNFWTQNYFGIKIFWIKHFFGWFFLAPNLAELKSRVWHSQPSLFYTSKNCFHPLN